MAIVGYMYIALGMVFLMTGDPLLALVYLLFAPIFFMMD